MATDGHKLVTVEDKWKSIAKRSFPPRTHLEKMLARLSGDPKFLGHFDTSDALPRTRLEWYLFAAVRAKGHAQTDIFGGWDPAEGNLDPEQGKRVK